MQHTITIHRHGGVSDTIDADVVGDFAIHEALKADEDRGRWAVTHVPTGWACVFTWTRAAAVQARKAFATSGLDWSFTDPASVSSEHREKGRAIARVYQGR